MPYRRSIEVLTGQRLGHPGDTLVWSEVENAYVPDDEITRTTEDGVVHEDNASTCDRCCESVCHDDNQADHLDLVIDHDQHWCEACRDQHAAYYSDDETDNPGWYAEAPERSGLLDYHQGDRDIEGTTSEHPFLIGFEVEKEDGDIRRELAENKDILPAGWVAERDGSLSEATGFELVSPAYNMHTGDARVRADIQTAKRFLDAGHSKACGGHISISDTRHTPMDFAERIRPLFPLLMALYPKRLIGSYSRPMKDKDKGCDRYQAFAFYHNRIELRIPSAVPSADTLLWRYELVRHVVMASQDAPITWSWMRKQMKTGGAIKDMLSRAYNGNTQKVNAVHRMFNSFSAWYYREKPASELIAGFLVNYRPQDVAQERYITPEPPPPPAHPGPPADQWFDRSTIDAALLPSGTNARGVTRFTMEQCAMRGIVPGAIVQWNGHQPFTVPSYDLWNAAWGENSAAWQPEHGAPSGYSWIRFGRGGNGIEPTYPTIITPAPAPPIVTVTDLVTEDIDLSF